MTPASQVAAGRNDALRERGLPTEVRADLGTVGVWDDEGQVDGRMPAMTGPLGSRRDGGEPLQNSRPRV
jgi:hypothetical protein